MKRKNNCHCFDAVLLYESYLLCRFITNTCNDFFYFFLDNCLKELFSASTHLSIYLMHSFCNRHRFYIYKFQYSMFA